MQLKNGVKIEGLKVEILLGLLILSDVFKTYDVPLVVTSALDGKHMHGSKHYQGQALDLRSKNASVDIQKKILAEGKEKLGENFDFILEGEGTDNEHLHVEFDPK